MTAIDSLCKAELKSKPFDFKSTTDINYCIKLCKNTTTVNFDPSEEIMGIRAK